jgi:hypothetical protein
LVGHQQSCALRAPTVFSIRIESIRMENTVVVTNNDAAGVLYKIVDCARMCFSSARNRRSARTGRRPRKFYRGSSMCRPTSIDTDVAAI